MPTDLPQESASAQRDRLFRVALLALAMGLFVAFWMVCSQQVRKAQMRDVSMQVQRGAIGDCLQLLQEVRERIDVVRIQFREHRHLFPGQLADAALLAN